MPEGFLVAGNEVEGNPKARGEGKELSGVGCSEDSATELYVAFLLPLAEYQGSKEKAKKVTTILSERAWRVVI